MRQSVNVSDVCFRCGKPIDSDGQAWDRIRYVDPNATDQTNRVFHADCMDKYIDRIRSSKHGAIRTLRACEDLTPGAQTTEEKATIRKTRKKGGKAKLTEAERLLKKRGNALAKLGTDWSAANRHGLVFGATTAAKILGITPKALATMAEPASFACNFHYRSGPRVALYDPIDLLRVSKQKRCAAARARCTPARKEAAQKVAFVRQMKVHDEAKEILATWEANLPDITWDELCQRAIASYQDIATMHDREPSDNRMENDLWSLVMNYLRHECSDYEYILARISYVMRGRVARDPLDGMDPANEARAEMANHLQWMAEDKWPELITAPYLGQTTDSPRPATASPAPEATASEERTEPASGVAQTATEAP